jgi:UDP-N-acetylglucosamine acyltransferase
MSIDTVTSLIHPSAIIHPHAELDSTVSVGPFSIIGQNVKVGANTSIGAHTVVDGVTTIGQNNVIYGFSSIGGQPQDKKYAGEPTELVIGDRNMIREFCTFNTGTMQDTGITTIGHDNWFMAYVHIAHDCVVGNNTIFANNSQLAGHVHVGDWAILGGYTGAHQFVRIGAHAMTGMGIKLMQDVPPFVMVAGTPYAPHGINVEGLKRRGFSKEAIAKLRHAFKTLYRQRLTLEQAKSVLRADVAQGGDGAQYVQVLLAFLESSERGILR